MSKDEALRDLIERVERATGPDRELDCHIMCVANGWTFRKFLHQHPNGQYISFRCSDGDKGLYSIPKYTASLDIAMTLIPEKAMCDGGWRVEYHHDLKRRCHATVWLHEDAEPGDDWFTGWGTTPALALCCASLRAHMGTGE